MVGGALDLIRGQSQELGSHIWEFHRQLGAMVARPAGATTGHDPAHEPSYGGLDPGEHVVGAARRDVRRPVRGAAAAFARISPQLGRADRRQARRRKKEATEREDTFSRLRFHSFSQETAAAAGGHGRRKAQ